MIPTEMKMEDLSGLEKLQPVLILNLVFAQGDKNIKWKTALHRRVYTRLIDKAVDEYRDARNQILAQIEEGQRPTDEINRSCRYIYMLKFVDHMENCISTVRRILRFLDILKRNQEGLFFSRTIKNQIESLIMPIIELRNAVEHMDEIIQKDGLQKNEPVMLKMIDGQDGILIGRQLLKFSSLSALIKQLHRLGQDMVAWRATDNA